MLLRLGGSRGTMKCYMLLRLGGSRHYEVDCTITCQVDLNVNKYGPPWMSNEREFVVFAVQGILKVISKHS